MGKRNLAEGKFFELLCQKNREPNLKSTATLILQKTWRQTFFSLVHMLVFRRYTTFYGKTHQIGENPQVYLFESDIYSK